MKKTVKIKTYKIDKGVKISEPAISVGGAPSAVPLTMQLLEPGDSFLVRDVLEGLKAEKRMRDFVTRENRRKGKREFVLRRMKNGVRIWRTK